MACINRNKLVNITELPQSYNIEPLDFFIIDGVQGLNTVCFDNIIFDIEQMEFEEEFDQQTTDIIGLSSALTDINNDMLEFVNERVAEVGALSSNLVNLLAQIGLYD